MMAAKIPIMLKFNYTCVCVYVYMYIIVIGTNETTLNYHTVMHTTLVTISEFKLPSALTQMLVAYKNIEVINQIQLCPLLSTL